MSIRLIKSLLVMLALSSASITSAQQQTPPQPLVLLNRLVNALETQSYVGEFTYEHSGMKLESFRILQAVSADAHVERLYRMTGTELEFVRSSDSPECGTMGGRLMAGARLNYEDGQSVSLAQNYVLKLAGRDRVAGRVAWVVHMFPRDQHRYGMMLSIDEASNLLLRYIIFDAEKGSALERLQFVSLETDVDLSPEELAPTPNTPMIPVQPQNCVGNVTPSQRADWRPSWLPPGFVISSYSYSEEDGHMESYTDGLSSFSLFSRAAQASEIGNYDGQPQQNSLSRGASTTLLTLRNFGNTPVLITVTGEIPSATAHKITMSMQAAAKAGG